MEPDENARSGDASSRGGARSRIPAASSLPRLQEITDAENNARAPTCMPPPSYSQKHRPVGRTLWNPLDSQPFKAPVSNELDQYGTWLGVINDSNGVNTTVPEPAAKQRKTLADRAGEPYMKQTPAPPSSRPVNGVVKATAAPGHRTTLSSSTNGSRFPSNSSRHTSSSSTSSIRTTTAAGSHRPLSAMSIGRSQFNLSNGGTRPASTMDDDGDESAPNSKHNGTIPSSRSPSPPFDSFVQIARQREPGLDLSKPSNFIQSSFRFASPDDEDNVFTRHTLGDVFANTAMHELSIGNASKNTSVENTVPSTPSFIPKPVTKDHPPSPTQKQETQSPTKAQRRPRQSLPSWKPSTFLNKSSNVQSASWDTDSRLDAMDRQFGTLKEQLNTMSSERSNVEEQINLYKTRVNELETMRTLLLDEKASLKSELEEIKVKLNSSTVALEDSRRSHSLEMDDLRRKNRNDTEDLREEHRRREEAVRRDTQDELEKLCRRHGAEIEEIEKKLKNEIEEERARRVREVDDLSSQLVQQRQNADIDSSARERETQNTKMEISQLNATIEQERMVSNGLKEKLAQAASTSAQLESDLEAAKAKSRFLESDSQAQSQAFADLNARMQEAIESATEANTKLRAEETLRRKLHNQVQELKGNIRVFCRVRPTLESEDDAARIAFPDDQEDCKEIVVTGPEKKSAIGNDATSKHNFSFDRVFGPSAGNRNVFEEISQLVQSALDGYNVCIFCYGQTGSGKTYTMSSADGMIPLAVKQIYDTAHCLEEKGWTYSMVGSFVEVYNENLNDLLGRADEIDKKKLEIRHDGQKCKTTITDVTEITLDSASTVSTLLKRASNNRSVAATKANERSSRSHSVFILKLNGENSITGERSEGTLNLVDLAGSERLTHSGVSGERLKETQSINRSLSCLGDVIGALGQGKDGGHIPYRNSKLTYLLQHSLGGNSKTLMFVMVSPLMAHLGETVTSLKFATKVHNTHIGTAKKQVKVKD